MAKKKTIKKKESPFKKNGHEILWNIINAGLAGSLVFLGSLTSGKITWEGVGAAIIASLIVIITKFLDYWATEKKEYTTKIFTFIN